MAYNLIELQRKNIYQTKLWYPWCYGGVEHQCGGGLSNFEIPIMNNFCVRRKIQKFGDDLLMVLLLQKGCSLKASCIRWLILHLNVHMFKAMAHHKTYNQRIKRCTTEGKRILLNCNSKQYPNIYHLKSWWSKLPRMCFLCHDENSNCLLQCKMASSIWISLMKIFGIPSVMQRSISNCSTRWYPFLGMEGFDKDYHLSQLVGYSGMEEATLEGDVKTIIGD